MRSKNITVKVDAEVYRKARIRAAEQGTSVSAMVREFLTHQAEEDDAQAQRAAALREMYRLADARAEPHTEPLRPLTRDEIYRERLR